MNPHILILEDEIIIAKSIKLILEADNYTASIATAPEDAMALLDKENFDLILSDVNLRHRIDGISFAQQYVPQHLPVIFLTAYSDTKTLHQAETVMPYGYLLKPFHKDQLLLTIKLSIAHARKQVLPSSISTSHSTENVQLSAREIEVVQQVVQGLTTQEIADMLCISPETVATHRKRIIRKTGCKNIVELMSFALDQGWI